MTVFKWQAQYNDGTTLNQIDDSGDKHAYEDIDRSRLLQFSLIRDNEPNNALPFFTVVFDKQDGEKLVWTRRTYYTIGSNEAKVFNIVGKKGQYIAAISPDEIVIIRDNFVNDGLFDEVLQ